jgi:hypothetical protein
MTHCTGYDPQTSTPAALQILHQKFGSCLERLHRGEKLAFLAIITHCLAHANQSPDTSESVFTLEDAWADLGYNLPQNLGGMLGCLTTLDYDDLLGICQTLLEHHNY